MARLKTGGTRRLLRSLIFLFFCFFVFLFFGLSIVYASITLRVVALNPSDESEQTVPIKVYLPMEVKPEDVIYKGDLEIAYDTQQGSYYVFGDYSIKPKEVLEKEIELKDIWTIDETQMVSIRKEAKETLRGFEKTPYADKATALYNNIDKKIKEIEDMQNINATTNPAQHISNYRYCLAQLNSVKADLVSAKTLLAEVSPKSAVKLTWKIIIFILGFLGILSLGFYIIWQKQAKMEGEQNEKKAF